LPPDGAVPSTPEDGNLVAHFAEPYWGWVYVYADGRVIWNPVAGATWELRLTPYGVDLVRAGAFAPSEFLNPSFSPPANAWADHEIKPYVASRYAICYRGNRGQLKASRIVGLLPGPAETLLRGKERTYDPVAGLAQEHRGPFDPPECSEVTTEEARALAEVLGDAVLGRGSGSFYDLVPPEWAVGSVEDQISISFNAILPHGTWAPWDG
jgi:hypothetical protein